MADVHVSNPSTYLKVLAALGVLTTLTVVAAYQDFGALNDIVALGIAITKASLVVWFFMHVNHAGRLVKTTVVAGLVWLLILLGMMLIDYVSRGTVAPDPLPVTQPLHASGSSGSH